MIENPLARNRYAGNGSTTVFSFTYRIKETTDLQVTIVNSLGVETLLVKDTDYTVSWSESSGDAGGSITYPISGTPLPTGSYIVIVRRMPLTQEIDLDAQSQFRLTVIEEMLDIAEMQIQQVQEQVSRCLTLPVTTDSDGETEYEEYLEHEANAAASATAAASSASSASSSSAASAVSALAAAQSAAAALVSQNEAENQAVIAFEAQSEVERMQGEIEITQDEVEATQVLANANQAACEAAQLASETAQTAAETAQGLSEDAKDASVIAQGLSEDARDASVIAQGLAETAQGLSEDARDASVIAQGLAEDARDQTLAYLDAANLPSSVEGQAGRVLIVKSDESGYEFGPNVAPTFEVISTDTVLSDLSADKIVVLSGGAKLTLPTPSDNAGYRVTVIRDDASNQSVIERDSESDTIDGRYDDYYLTENLSRVTFLFVSANKIFTL